MSMSFEVLKEKPEVEPRYPLYSDAGRVLFRWVPESVVTPRTRRASGYAEVIDYDGDSALHWMEEGIGISYFLGEELSLELEGYFVLEDIRGEYIRGNHSWGEDDDENWYSGNCRRATPEEIEYHELGPDPMQAPINPDEIDTLYLAGLALAMFTNGPAYQTVGRQRARMRDVMKETRDMESSK